MSERRPRARIEVTSYSPERAEALAGFIRRVWDPSATAESVRAAMARTGDALHPDGPPTALVLRDGEVIGHLTSHLERLWIHGREVPVAFLGGFHVLPEHRNSAVGMYIVREMEKLAPQSLAAMVLEAPLRLYTALGWREVGRSTDYVHVLDGAAFLRGLARGSMGGRAPHLALRIVGAGLAAPVGRAGTIAATALARVRQRSHSVTCVTSDAAAWTNREEANSLWRSLRDRIPASLVRDGTRLQARFGQVGDRYAIIEAREGAQLVGWCVVRRPRATGDERLGGMRVMPVVDLLYEPESPATVAALLRAAMRYARTEALAAALLLSTPNVALQRVLARLMFVRAGDTLRVVAHASLLGESSPTFEAWSYSRGDGDADQSF